MGIYCAVTLQIRHVVHASLGFKGSQDGEGFNSDAADGRGSVVMYKKVFIFHFVV